MKQTTTMRKESKVKNLADLRQEIARLNTLADEQKGYLGDQYGLFNERIEAPARFFKSMSSWIPGVDVLKGALAKGQKNEDWVNKAMRIGFPLVLNRFFLRKSGFVKRALLTVLSQQAAGVLNKDRLSAVINRVADFVRPSKKNQRGRRARDYGIPPDSETY